MSIRPQMTAQQAEALAAYLVSLRPGQRSWTKNACVDALAQAAAAHTNDTELLTRAAVAAALKSSVRTPDVIPMPGAHWDGVGDYARETPKPGGRCVTCREIHNGPCDPAGTPADYSTAAAAARAAIKPTRRYDLATPLKEGTTP